MIVDSINDRIERVERMVRVVVTGTLGDRTGMFDAGPGAVSRGGPNGDRLDRSWAFAGSGGMYANCAREIAFRWRPEVVGEALLWMIADVATDGDNDSAKPIWRIDLADGTATTAYKWTR